MTKSYSIDAGLVSPCMNGGIIIPTTLSVWADNKLVALAGSREQNCTIPWLDHSVPRWILKTTWHVTRVKSQVVTHLSSIKSQWPPGRQAESTCTCICNTARCHASSGRQARTIRFLLSRASACPISRIGDWFCTSAQSRRAGVYCVLDEDLCLSAQPRIRP